MNTVQAGRSGF